MNTIKTSRISLVLGSAALLIAAAGAQAATPHGMALCKDGSQSMDMQRKGACADHGGVKRWYGKSTMAAAGTGMATPSGAAAGSAVQTQSAKVSATNQAPQTGNASKTPAKPDTAAK